MVADLYSDGHSSHRLATRFGVTPQTVINIVRRAGVPIRVRGLGAYKVRRAAATKAATAATSVPVLSDTDLGHALNLWARSTYTTTEIAKILCVSEAAVANSIGRFHGFTRGRAA